MLFSHIFILSAHIKYPSIKPIVSLFVITAAAQEDENPSSFAKLVAEFPENIKLEEEGRPLECCAMWWLRVRLCTAAGKRESLWRSFWGLTALTFAPRGKWANLTSWRVWDTLFFAKIVSFPGRFWKLASQYQKCMASGVSERRSVGYPFGCFWHRCQQVVRSLCGSAGQEEFQGRPTCPACTGASWRSAKTRQRFSIQLAGSSQGREVLCLVFHYSRGCKLCEWTCNHDEARGYRKVLRTSLRHSQCNS